jgi:hypothetical protein
MCDKFILKFILKSVFWISQILYVKRWKPFTDSSLVAVDFMSTNLTAVLFSNCDLYRSEFERQSTKPILEPATTIQ